MKNHKIDIVAHLKYGNCMVDVVEIAKFASTNGAYIELNGKRINFTDDEIRGIIDSGARFIIDSDAHRSCKVGENNHALNIITRLKIDEKYVVNLDKLPKFKNHKGS
jgi:putative hydrolase